MIPLENDMKHVIGNSIFAIETNMMCLRGRIERKQTENLLEVLDDMQTSVDRIKNFLNDKEVSEDVPVRG